MEKKTLFFHIWFVLYKMKYISSLEPICRPWKIRTWSIDVNKESKSCYKKSMTLLITSCSSEVETIERIEWREQFGKSPLFLNEWTCTSYSVDCQRICWTCYPMKSTIKARKYGEQNIEDQNIRPPRVCSWDWARGRIKSRRRRRRRRRQDVAVGLRLDLILTRTSLDEPPASSNNQHNYVNASPLLPPRFFYSPIFLHQLIFASIDFTWPGSISYRQILSDF